MTFTSETINSNDFVLILDTSSNFTLLAPFIPLFDPLVIGTALSPSNDTSVTLAQTIVSFSTLSTNNSM